MYSLRVHVYSKEFRQKSEIRTANKITNLFIKYELKIPPPIEAALLLFDSFII